MATESLTLVVGWEVDVHPRLMDRNRNITAPAPNQPIRWISSDPSVCRVRAHEQYPLSCWVEAVAPGEAQVTAHMDNPDGDDATDDPPIGAVCAVRVVADNPMFIELVAGTARRTGK